MSGKPGPRQAVAGESASGSADDTGWRRRRIAIVISSLRGGGAERVVTVLANAWTDRGDEVTILTLDDETPFYPLAKEVVRVGLGVAGESRGFVAVLRNNLRRVASLRAGIRRSEPETVISFIDTANVLALLATRGLKAPVIVSERSDPAHFPTGRATRILRRILYPLADAVIVQTEGAARFFGAGMKGRLHVIPNPVLPGPGETPALTCSQRRIVALGRLSKEKGFDLLIEAFSEVAPKWPGWSLEIWGEGPGRAELDQLIRSKGMRDQVRLPGWTPSPHQVLRGAALFVLPSRVEGFPNALCEAMAAGVTVLAADCPSGPRDIIRDGVDGLLVSAGDAIALARAIDRLLGDEKLRMRLAGEAPNVVSRFGLARVLGLWDGVLDRVSSRERHTR